MKGNMTVTAMVALVLRMRLGKQSDAKQVSLTDIEEQLRALTSGARDAVLSSKRNTIAAGVLGGIATVAGAYLHGLRRGKRRATVIEVVRK
jgi:hypothetical protein